MKTLKISALLFAGLLCANTMSAQKGAYAKFNLGYNFSLNSDNITTESTTTDGVTLSEKNITGSFGKGLALGGTFGYMFSDNIGAELGLNYLLGGTFESEDKSTGTTTGFEYVSTLNQKFSAKMFQINPSIVLSAGKTKGLNPYARFGIVLGMAGKITNENDRVQTGLGAYTSKSVNELSGGMALGWSAAFGATYNFSEKLGLFGEMNMINMSWAPTSMTVTESTTDGVDNLPTMDVNQKETEFVDEVKSTDNVSNTVASTALKNNFSFSSLGIQIGLRFQF